MILTVTQIKVIYILNHSTLGLAVKKQKALHIIA